jgi:hypothetical protein
LPDAKYFARKAERCRELLKLARVPEVIEQLRVWAAEFEAEAQKQHMAPATQARQLINASPAHPGLT